MKMLQLGRSSGFLTSPNCICVGHLLDETSMVCTPCAQRPPKNVASTPVSLWSQMSPKGLRVKGWANGPGTSNSEARPVGPEQDSDKGVFVIQSHGLSENLSENRVHIFIHWSIIILPVKM